MALDNLTVRTDQFDQTVYVCPKCNHGFLTTPKGHTPTDAQLLKANEFHWTHAHPNIPWSENHLRFANPVSYPANTTAKGTPAQD